MLKKSGVDIDLGNQSSKIAYNYAIETFPNRKGKAGAIGSKSDGGFSNLLLFGKQRIGIGSDGIGTKAEIAERTGIYDTLGYDLVAMVADDLAAMGFEPTNLSNVIDVDYLDIDIIEGLMKGLRDACNFAGIAITGGEIAELGDRVGGFGEKMHFNWSSTAIGILPDNLEEGIDGHAVKEGDIIIALKSRGFRSNGYSSIRRILREQFGDQWHNEMYDDEMSWGQKMLSPSLIYSPVVNAVIRADIELKSVVHITGGGIFDNLRRVLKINKLGAYFDNLFEPLPEMLKVQELGKVSNEDAYLWWNMGNGMLLITDKKNSDDVIKIINNNDYEAKVAGIVQANTEIVAGFPGFELKKRY
jgi:phosphoribosylformylglycinamidine cyclo-ligase